jgi:hypothetical protein
LCLALREQTEHRVGIREAKGVALSDICVMAAPEVGVDPVHCLCPKRVPVDVFDQAEKIGIPIAQNRLISPLEEVAYGLVSPVEVHSVRLAHPLHELGKRDVLSLNEQMNMIAHENVGIDADAHAVLVDGQGEEIFLEVGNILENALPLVAADDDMVKSAGEFYAGFSWHERRIAKEQEEVNISSFQA